MDDDTFRSSSSPPATDPEDNDAAAAASPPTSTGASDLAGAASSSPKKQGRRAVQKRVVSVPIGDLDGARSRSVDGAPPPTDKWAWRKYGQKPIKGSPYPRGYYRCSSSKGCPARKQVERSREEPNMLLVTYSSDHNHPWPIPKNHHHHHHSSSPRSKQHQSAPPPPAADSGGDSEFVLPAGASSGAREFCWFSSDDTLLYGSIAVDVAMMQYADELVGGEKEEEEDALFAGLGELPECSVVFRRGFLGGSRLTTAGSSSSSSSSSSPAAAAAAAATAGTV